MTFLSPTALLRDHPFLRCGPASSKVSLCVAETDGSSTGLPIKSRGSIVNVGSLCSSLAISNLTPYIMAKHGVLGLTKGDAMDYGAQGIRVNCICPGWIATGMTEHLVSGALSEVRHP